MAADGYPSGAPLGILDYPSTTPSTPWYTQVPREHAEYPQYPPDHPLEYPLVYPPVYPPHSVAHLRRCSPRRR